MILPVRRSRGGVDEGPDDRSAGCAVAGTGRADRARPAPLGLRAHPGQPGHVDGHPDAAADHPRAPVAGHHAQAQGRRPRRGDRGRGHLLRAGHPDRRHAVRPDRARPQDRPLQRPTAPVDADHGRAVRDLHGAAGRAEHGLRRGRAVVPVQRVPERRVRQPERGHPRPRAGAAARHGVRLGRHADRARPGPGHRPGRGRPRPAHSRQLRHARGGDGGAGPAVRPVHPGPPAGAAPPGPVLLAPAGFAPTGSARGSIPISAGPG